VAGDYYVYILSNQRNGTLYTGVTNNLKHRVWQHKSKLIAGFTRRYGVDRLVYFGAFRNISSAIAREKQIKAGSRKRKLKLIERDNPAWNDLSAGWYWDLPPSHLSSRGAFFRPEKRAVAIQSAGLLRRFAPRNDGMRLCPSPSRATASAR
jgi:putative endonuclease